MNLFKILELIKNNDRNHNIFDNEDIILKKIKKFVINGGDINKNAYGKNAIILASENGFIKIVYYLLINNLDKGVNYIDHTGISILMHACMYGYFEIVELLLKNHVNINYQDMNGKTALMYASEFGKTDIVEMLLIYGADYKLKDKKGCSAYSYSCYDLHTDITIMLIKRRKN